MTTEPDTRRPQQIASRRRRAGTVQRYNRRTRWFHAGIYLTVLVLLATGWWLRLGQEGRPSPLSRIARVPDTELHTWTGWALVGVAALGLVLGARAVRTFAVETVRFRRADLTWFARWPRALWTGRFARHDGHFDPGQRIANVVIVTGLAALIGSGVGMALLHGGPAFVVLVRVHRWSTYVLTPVLLGHILITFLPPGYRGAWRSMHLGGRLNRAVARRLWPGWLERVSDPDRRPAGRRRR
jgi:cytochrome b subunit of formate dehydrogenase